MLFGRPVRSTMSRNRRSSPSDRNASEHLAGPKHRFHRHIGVHNITPSRAMEQSSALFGTQSMKFSHEVTIIGCPVARNSKMKCDAG